ncbi:MAG: hypothetical protein MJ252_13575 [archaeon]|nr:hypothetical protein [archaeon]
MKRNSKRNNNSSNSFSEAEKKANEILNNSTFYKDKDALSCRLYKLKSYLNELKEKEKFEEAFIKDLKCGEKNDKCFICLKVSSPVTKMSFYTFEATDKEDKIIYVALSEMGYTDRYIKGALNINYYILIQRPFVQPLEDGHLAIIVNNSDECSFFDNKENNLIYLPASWDYKDYLKKKRGFIFYALCILTVIVGYIAYKKSIPENK